MSKVVVRLDWVKSTPGTHFYEAKDPSASIRSVYVRKDSPVFTDGKLDAISVTVEKA